MTSTLTFPSDSAPAFPALSLELPESWASFGTAGAVIAAGRAVPSGEFRPNVIVAVSRFGAGYTLEQATAEVTAQVSAIDGVVELGRDTLPVLGGEGFRIEFSYTDARVGTLMQGVRIAVVENGPVADLVQITATATGEQATTLWGELRDIQASAARA
ncbi:hypothetical protein B7R54_00210 [Subtercola boreus]|uniref:Uncharacterized protein n=1 Tax=Subtercola boreus TaxID=120213 RepID=A0A3E0VD24_9MICO|nr:hypothetical protein [Subtercola boreus]RFA07806.1 hypothetical protein B7R54_00210 [Subtercola boreus]TQL55347.1 hypothetical protein FB464_2910 [Subtercola boreus]